MEATNDDSKIFVRPFPSLSHLSTVAVALPLLNNFDLMTLRKAFSEEQSESATPSEAGSQSDPGIRARDAIHPIPHLFRERVLKAIHGMHWEITRWSYRHSMIFKLTKESFYHWKSDGSIDTIKMAQQVLLNQNIGIKKRFEIACKYGLDENVKSLWSEMKKSDKAKCEKSPDNSLVGFWVRWLHEGSPKPWSQAADEYLSIPQREILTPLSRLFSLFPSMHLEDRKILLDSSLSHNYLFCIHTMTKEEQEDILKESAKIVLSLYMFWPRQSAFMEVAEKLFRFLKVEDFCRFLGSLSGLDYRGDFDYSELFQEFWKTSPNSWKERARKVRKLQKAISSCCAERNKKENTKNSNESVKRKRKAGSNTGRKRKCKKL